MMIRNLRKIATRVSLALVVLVILAFLLPAVALYFDKPVVSATTAAFPEDPDGNFVLSMGAYAPRPVDIRIWIDGVLAIYGEVGMRLHRRTHYAVRHKLKLSPGVHQFRAESTQLGVSFTSEFEVQDRVWGILRMVPATPKSTADARLEILDHDPPGYQ